MKKLVKVFAIAMVMFAVACGGTSSQEGDLSGKEYTSEYVCPMHCDGSGSDEEGKCPVCGMDYVLNEDHQKDGHQH